MSHSKGISRRLVIAAGASALAMPYLGRPAQAATVLRYGHMHTPASIAGAQAEWFAKAVAEKTDGALQVQIFPNSQLGKLQELAEAVSTGAIAFSHNTAGAVGSLHAPFAAFDTPYLYRDIDHLMAVMDAQSPVMQSLNQGLVEASGVRALYAFYFGTRNLTADRAVTTPADLKGVKIRSIPFPIYMATVEGLGGVPVPVDWAEVPTALATGVVNGQENPMNVLLSAKLYEVQSHVMLTGHIAAAQVVMMNDDVWQGLSAEHQQAVAEAATETRAQASEAMLSAEASDLQALRDAGMVVVDAQAGLDLAAFRDSVKARVSREFDAQWGDLYAQIAAIA